MNDDVLRAVSELVDHMIFGGSIWIERKLMDKLFSVISAIRERFGFLSLFEPIVFGHELMLFRRYDVIGGYNVQIVPMREQSVGVNALSGQLDLRSRLCRFHILNGPLICNYH